MYVQPDFEILIIKVISLDLTKIRFWGSNELMGLFVDFFFLNTEHTLYIHTHKYKYVLG